MPAYFGDVVNDLGPKFSSENADDILIIALQAGLVYMALSLGSGIFLFLTRQTIIVMSRLIEFDLKNEIYKQYQKLDFTFYRSHATGDLMNRISEDVSHVRMYLGPGVMYTINLVILFILSLYTMISISPFLTLFVLLPLPFMSFIIYKVSSRINQLSKVVQEEQSGMSSLVQESFSGIRVIKAYSRNDHIKNRFENSANRYQQKSMRLVLINALFMPTIFVLIGLSTLLCIYLGGLIYRGNEISFGEIMAFIFYVNMLTWPFASIGWVTSLTQRAAASQERINQFLKTTPDIVNSSNDPFKFEDKIEFKNVSFTYQNSGITALKNLNLTIKKGERFGVVGRTGCGKTTLIHLLTRQMDPDEGEILIDGKNLKSINLEAFRDYCGVVPQDVFLFSESIRSNLEFGNQGKPLTDDEMISACKAVHVDHNIQEFEHGYDTILGERGVNLSGGQKQRLSIARAILRKPEILLLDDCLSAVDTETEEIILNNLSKQKGTSFVVSHRISTIRNAHQILVLEDGQIVEKGRHEQLLEINGIYADLYRKQLLEEDEKTGE